MIAALVGFTVVMTTIIWYLMTIDKETVPENVGVFNTVLILGFVTNMVGIWQAPGVVSITTGVISGMLAGLILYLMSIRRLPGGELIARIGEPMPALAAVDQGGQPFDLSALRGKRVLFKFFRGSW